VGLLILSGVLLACLGLNAFFVLAEFAIVKVRPSRVTQLAEAGNRRAVLLAGIQARLDEYLSVCQVGITLASVALGMVGEKTAAILMGDEGTGLRYLLAIGVSYLLISGSHILLGELVPKSVAIRLADLVGLWCAWPLRICHVVFFPALWLLTKASNAILRLIGLGKATHGDEHSEKELRIILDQSQERGLMSFRRLLFMENVFDFGALTVKDAMRVRSYVRALDARLTWAENLQVVRASHFTRYPLITSDPERPSGFVHLKDLIIHNDYASPDLRNLARPLLWTTEATRLEALFAEMQRRRIHVALVADTRNRYTGLVTLEDVMEEIVGTIRDEFEEEEQVRLADAVDVERVHLDIEADSPVAAVRKALARMTAAALPVSAAQILRSVAERESLVGTYMGHGIGMPHARIAGLGKSFVMVLRSEQGVAYQGTVEKARLLFVLLTPAGQPRAHQRLLSIIATLLTESEYVKERLLTATSAEEVVEVIRTGEQAVLD
jgi:CBS domain containing-hemolysin-like protein/mannitol/fructose-specific phosphotransferase system IIA component